VAAGRQVQFGRLKSGSGLGYSESHTYDALDRLTNASGPGAQSLSVGYDALGNVTSRSDVGSYGYHAVRKHAVVSAGSNSYTYDANGNMATRNGSTLTWTSDNLPASLSASGYTASFNYAPDRRRWRQVSTYAGATETTIYVGGLLEKLTTSVRVHWKHRIPTPSGEVQVIRRSDGTMDTFYVATDHLGSTDTVMDAAGTVLVRESFGSWGARRGSNWQGVPSPSEWQSIANTTRRGYTGHEELDNVLLVHMNGRVYDPAIGRFLSADPYVSNIDASQGWNRYAYVTNNPLAFTDPSGFDFRRGDSLRSLVRNIGVGWSPDFGGGADGEYEQIVVTGTRLSSDLLSWMTREFLRNLDRGVVGLRGGESGGGGGNSGGDGSNKNGESKPPCDSQTTDSLDASLAVTSAIAEAADSANIPGTPSNAADSVADAAASVGTANAARLAPGFAARSADWARIGRFAGYAGYAYATYSVARDISQHNYGDIAYTASDILIGAGLVTGLGGVPGVAAAAIFSASGGSKGAVNKAKDALGLCAGP